MKINKIILASTLFAGLLFFSCSDLTETQDQLRLTPENVKFDPSYAEGLLLKGYRGLPTVYTYNEDVASDDAVTNVLSSTIINMNTGGWNSASNPFDRWGRSYEMFLYLNTFLEYAPEVTWDRLNPTKNTNFADKLMGEALALRALYGFNLLQAHAGVAQDGTLLGYPIVTKILGANDDYKLPRNTYAECVNQIVSDLDMAIAKLPLTWVDRPNDPAYSQSLGLRNTNRINGLTAKLIKSRVLLYAASPAFSATSGRTWNDAAIVAADIIKDKGGFGPTVIRASDLTWYTTPGTSTEIIWATTTALNTSTIERNNFPPSLFGLGQTNPTQDLVDSFPMRDGTPFVKSANTSVSQYLNRDPRLAAYVIFNDMVFGGAPVRMASLPANINAPGNSQQATRSGYYLKKFMIETVKVNPGAPTVGATHYYTYARYTEALLNFAEAANEAVGPDGLINGYSARAVINALRTRAGITSTAFINSLDKDRLRTAIRNERRLELCFEGFRFWDIRRWDDKATMKSSVNGVKISADNIAATVSIVEPRLYQDFQIYGPIPFDETQKYDALKQNKGWQ
jgi:starch-binding outer membrane protein, SusD/RagB family